MIFYAFVHVGFLGRNIVCNPLSRFIRWPQVYMNASAIRLDGDAHHPLN